MRLLVDKGVDNHIIVCHINGSVATNTRTKKGNKTIQACDSSLIRVCYHIIVCHVDGSMATNTRTTKGDKTNRAYGSPFIRVCANT